MLRGFKIALKQLGILILIGIASIGIGIAGGAPVPRSNKRDETVEIKIELVEPREDDASSDKLFCNQVL